MQTKNTTKLKKPRKPVPKAFIIYLARAKRTLMRRWPNQYQADYFEDTTKEEFPEFAVGTPLYWTRDIYFGEADCYPADEELRNMLLIESVDWEAEAKKL